MRTVAALLCSVALVVTGCAGERAAEREVDHRTDLVMEETRGVTAHLVPVPGYTYVNASGSEIEGTAEIIDRMNEAIRAQVGEDLVVGLSLHSVVADDPAQNTARTWNGGREVGYLKLMGFTEPVPSEVERSLASWMFGGQLPVAELQIAGTEVYLFVDEASRYSRYEYVWVATDHVGMIDGADREPVERWLQRYLAQSGSV